MLHKFFSDEEHFIIEVIILKPLLRDSSQFSGTELKVSSINDLRRPAHFRAVSEITFDTSQKPRLMDYVKERKRELMIFSYA